MTRSFVPTEDSGSEESSRITGRGTAWRLLLSSDSPRARRSGDVILLVVAVVALVLLSLAAVPPSRVEAGLASVADAVPSLFDGVWWLTVGLVGVWTVLLLVLVLTRRRWLITVEVVLAAGLTVVVGVLVGRAVVGAWDPAWTLPMDVEQLRWSPWLRVSLPVAAIVTLAPWATRPVRRVGAWLIGACVISAFLLGVAPTLVVATVAVALTAGSIIRLAFGSPEGWPDTDSVRARLAVSGLGASDISVPTRAPGGIFLLNASRPDGSPLDVKVYGREATDTQILTSLWRRIWYRAPVVRIMSDPLHRAEHEALATIYAARGGVSTPDVVMTGKAADGDALLVLQRQKSETREWDVAAVRDLWLAVDRLHTSGLTHGQIDVDRVTPVHDGVVIHDFSTANTSPEEWHRDVDLVQALVTSALAIGSESAIDVAVEVLGEERLRSILPRVQPALLSRLQQQDIKRAGWNVDDLRRETASRLGIEAPPLETLSRVTLGSITRVALPVVAFFILASVVAGLDLDQLVTSLADASVWFLAAGFVMAQLARVGQAMSIMGASPVPIPLGRIWLLEMSLGYISLTIPSAAARIAMATRFLQRHGLAVGGALAVGALDNLGSFVSQILLVALILMFSSLAVDLNLDSSVTQGVGNLVAIVGVVALVAVLAVIVVPRFRRQIVDRVSRIWAEAREVLNGAASPRRLGLLLGGNLFTEIVYAIALGAFTLAFGYTVGLPELILIVVLVSLLAGLLPVPGGVGVAEGGIILGLSRTGVPEEVAFAIAISFRAATYYLPPIWGYFAYRHLEREGHL